MSSSSGDELPEIPGTRFPWMESSSSRSPRKPTKRPRVSAVEKERKTYKDPKKKPWKMDLSSDDDDFEDPVPGPSKSSNPGISAADIKRQKAKEKVAKWRSKRTEEKKIADREKDAQRKAAERVNETPAEHARRNIANAQQTAAARANETPEEHLQRNQANAEQQAVR